jgi:transcription elongation factor Elf1
VLDVLLENAILDKDLRPEDMVSGDRNYLLIEIRKTGFGNEYKPGEVSCGSCGQEYDPIVDLNKLKPKMLEMMPDEKGEYPLELPLTKMAIKFRLLRGSDEKRLSKLIEVGQKRPGGFKAPRLITERYLLQIMEVNGNRDKTYISKFINAMPTKDSLFFREYNRQIEPGIDLDYEFECPYCSHCETKSVPINSKLFYPDVE